MGTMVRDAPKLCSPQLCCLLRCTADVQATVPGPASRRHPGGREGRRVRCARLLPAPRSLPRCSLLQCPSPAPPRRVPEKRLPPKCGSGLTTCTLPARPCPPPAVRVMAGSSLGVAGPIKLRNPGLLLDVRLAPGAKLAQVRPCMPLAGAGGRGPSQPPCRAAPTYSAVHATPAAHRPSAFSPACLLVTPPPPAARAGGVERLCVRV